MGLRRWQSPGVALPGSWLSAGGGPISADIVIGQQNLPVFHPKSQLALRDYRTPTSLQPLVGLDSTHKAAFMWETPSGIAWIGRVLVFVNPSAALSNASADRVMAFFPQVQRRRKQHRTRLNWTTLRVSFSSRTVTATLTSALWIPTSTASCSFRPTIMDPGKSACSPAGPVVTQGGVIGQNLSLSSFLPNGEARPLLTPPLSPTVLYFHDRSSDFPEFHSGTLRGRCWQQPGGGGAAEPATSRVFLTATACWARAA